MAGISRLLVVIAIGCLPGCGRDADGATRSHVFAGLDFERGTDMAQPVESFSYFTGLGGQLLLLAADGTYRRTAHGCTGGVQEEGHFTRDATTVTLHEPTRRTERGADPEGRRLSIVTWGDRTYLIQDDERTWLYFCNSVNRGDEPRSGGTSGFLLREGDQDVAVTGSPKLPDAWAGFLLPEPVEGHMARNSGLFYLLSKYSTDLRDMTIFHELLNKKGRAYSVTVGRPIASEALDGDPTEVALRLQQHTVEGLAADRNAVFG